MECPCKKYCVVDNAGYDELYEFFRRDRLFVIFVSNYEPCIIWMDLLNPDDLIGDIPIVKEYAKYLYVWIGSREWIPVPRNMTAHQMIDSKMSIKRMAIISPHSCYHPKMQIYNGCMTYGGDMAAYYSLKNYEDGRIKPHWKGQYIIYNRILFSQIPKSLKYKYWNKTVYINYSSDI